jgi:hypothetical protein
MNSGKGKNILRLVLFSAVFLSVYIFVLVWVSKALVAVPLDFKMAVRLYDYPLLIESFVAVLATFIFHFLAKFRDITLKEAIITVAIFILFQLFLANSLASLNLTLLTLQLICLPSIVYAASLYKKDNVQSDTIT